MLVFQKLAIAAGLGLLVGMQREHVESELAGIRTFTLITIFGALSGLMLPETGPAIVAAGVLAVAAMLIVGNLAKIQRGESDPGLTTEIAALVMYALGVYLMVGPVEVGVVLGGAVAVLLQFKQPMHSLVAKVGSDDIKAIMQLVLIALVILPVLPDQAYGPYEVLNPREIWTMVVLIVGIGLVGYIAYKLLGQQAGAVLAGMLGGLISSTATTVGYSRQTRDNAESASTAALVIMIASTVAFARVIFEIAVVARGAIGQLGPPLGAMLGWMALISFVWFWFARRDRSELPQHGNPAQLKTALVFGALYAVMIFAVAAVQHYLGDRWLYLVAIVSGLTDVDAITLSTSRLVADERLLASVGWRLVLVASLSNLVFKAGAAALLGHRRLTWQLGLLFGLGIAGGILLLLAWPDDWVIGVPASPRPEERSGVSLLQSDWLHEINSTELVVG